jgi:uncharacterized protein (TIGR00369 family)
MTDDHAQLAARCEGTPYHIALGIRVEAVTRDHVRVRVPYKDDNSNPGRALHGGVAASTIDICGTLAAWTGFTPRPGFEAGTLDLSVNYLAAAIGEDIVATGTVLRRGKEIVYVDVDIRNDAQKPIAKGLVTVRAADPARRPTAAARQRAADPAILRGPFPAGGGADDVPKLARAIVAVPFMARLGLDIAYMKDGLARIGMPYASAHDDGAGALHEGAVAALIDTTGAMASWSITGIDFRYKASTVGIHVNFHGRTDGEDLVAYGRTLRRDDEIFLNHVVVCSRASERLVATGAVTYRIVVPTDA